MIFLSCRRAQVRTSFFQLQLVAAYLCASGFAAAQVKESRPSFPVTSSQIVSAMQSRQLPTQGAQIRIAAPITASLENPQLDIQAIALISPREVRMRLSCRNRAVCPAFFALVSYPQGENAPSLPAKFEASASALPAVSGIQQQSRTTAVAAPEPKSPNAGPAEPTLRIGSPVMLQIDSARVHILIEVVCLENGSIGDMVRVTTRDHKHSYVAQIVTPTLLKGSL